MKLFALLKNYHFTIFTISLYLVMACHNLFWQTITTNPNVTQHPSYFLLFIIGAFLTFLYALILELITFSLNARLMLIVITLITTISSYYMNHFHISINPMIIESLFKTNLNEAKDFINLSMIFKILLLLTIPLIMIFLIDTKNKSLFIKTKFLLLFFYLLILIAIWVCQGKNITFIFKSYKPTIDMLNPIAPIRSTIRYFSNIINTPKTYTFVGADAKITPNDKPKIFALIIGESARAKNFEFNNYHKPTNPFTKNLDILNFKDFYSCGVITAISIPCMLTDLTHQTYTSRNLSLFRNNLLDIAQNTGYDVWWISNNGGECMGKVCRNIKNISYYNQQHLDTDMLQEINTIISNTKNNTFLIINLHGSHGAKYFERYPKDFEFFHPVCKDENLQNCTQESLQNAYDNSLRYTDYFISQVISFLKESSLDSGLWYVSDHGESLGEYGQFMHGGLPYNLAPKDQKHIPSYIWLNKELKTQFYDKIQKQTHTHLTHDTIFHTILHFLNIETKDYNKQLDIIEMKK